MFCFVSSILDFQDFANTGFCKSGFWEKVEEEEKGRGKREEGEQGGKAAKRNSV